MVRVSRSSRKKVRIKIIHLVIYKITKIQSTIRDISPNKNKANNNSNNSNSSSNSSSSNKNSR